MFILLFINVKFGDLNVQRVVNHELTKKVLAR